MSSGSLLTTSPPESRIKNVTEKVQKLLRQLDEGIETRTGCNGAHRAATKFQCIYAKIKKPNDVKTEDVLSLFTEDKGFTKMPKTSDALCVFRYSHASGDGVPGGGVRGGIKPVVVDPVVIKLAFFNRNCELNLSETLSGLYVAIEKLLDGDPHITFGVTVGQEPDNLEDKCSLLKKYDIEVQIKVVSEALRILQKLGEVRVFDRGGLWGGMTISTASPLATTKEYIVCAFLRGGFTRVDGAETETLVALQYSKPPIVPDWQKPAAITLSFWKNPRPGSYSISCRIHSGVLAR